MSHKDILESLRTDPKVIEMGYKIIPFPKDLRDLLLQYIENFIYQATEKMDNLTNAILSISDEEFIQKFSKPFRLFPDTIGFKMEKWAQSLNNLIGVKRTGVNFISPAEREANPSLNKTSYDIFWRCVRPNKSDVGKPHCDFQFWEIAKGTKDEAPCPFSYDERWKIWIPLIGCTTSNSLQVLPGSHRQEIPIEYIQTRFGKKPNIADSWLEEHKNNFICPFSGFSDCCILFHDKLVHKGPPNFTNELRVSGELTILAKI